MKKIQIIFLLSLISFPMLAQDTILLMSYNLLGYPGTNSGTRNPY